MTPAAHAPEELVAAANQAFYDAREGRDIATTNVFAKSNGWWLLVTHHGSAVMSR